MKIKVPCPFALLWPTTRISSTLVFGRFYVTTSLPSFIKVGKTPAIQNLVLEQYAVKIDNSTLFLYDKILIYHDCDFKKTRIQKLLNRVEKYRHVCVFVCHLFSFYPCYFDFHSAGIIFDVSSGIYLWNINKTTA